MLNHTLILKNLPQGDLGKLREEIYQFVRESVRSTSFQVVLQAGKNKNSFHKNYPVIAYLDFEQSDKAEIALQSIKEKIAQSKEKGDFFLSRKIEAIRKETQVSRSPKKLQTAVSSYIRPQDFLNSLPVKEKVNELLAYLSENPSESAIFTSCTGSGKTRGIAVRALTQSKNVFLVLPKTIQVRNFVSFITNLLPTARIGFAANREITYSLQKPFDLVVVTYGHFVQKVVNLLRDSQGRQCTLNSFLVIFDEAHEATDDVHAGLALAHKITNQKVITSATLDLSALLKFDGVSRYRHFSHECDTKFPIAFEYCNECDHGNRPSLTNKVCSIVEKRIRSEDRILIFVAGLGIMDSIILGLVNKKLVRADEVAEVHSDMWQDEIEAAVSSARILVATNVIESSVTISGLTLVIDTMLKNEVVDNSVLREVYISRAEATQRAGRVGRSASGTVIRLISQADFEALDPFPAHPFELNDPYSIFLRLSTAFDSVLEVPRILQLGEEQTARCMAELMRIGALDNKGKITELGERLLEIPISLRLACPVARASMDMQRTSQERMLVLVVASAFEALTTFFYKVPRERRSKGYSEAVRWIQEECGGIFGPSPLMTVTNLLLDALNRPEHFRYAEQSQSSAARRHCVVDSVQLRMWCAERRVNSKYMAAALQLLVTLSESLFPNCLSKSREGKLWEYHHVKDLLAAMRPRQESAARLDAALHLLGNCVGAFGSYMPERFIHIGKGRYCQFATARPGAEPSLIPAFPTLLELAQPPGPQGYPVCAASLSVLRRRRFGAKLDHSQLDGMFSLSPQALLDEARRARTEPERERAAAELSCLAATTAGCQYLLSAADSQLLLGLLETDGASGRRRRQYAALAVSRLLTNGGNKARATLVDAGACQAVVALLRSLDEDASEEIFLAAAQAVKHLSMGDGAALRALVAAGACCATVELAQRPSVGKDVLSALSAALERFAGFESAVPVLLECDACRVLVALASIRPAVSRRRKPEDLVVLVRAVGKLSKQSPAARYSLAAADACSGLAELVDAGIKQDGSGSVQPLAVVAAVEALAALADDDSPGRPVLTMLRSANVCATLERVLSWSTQTQALTDAAATAARIALQRIDSHGVGSSTKPAPGPRSGSSSGSRGSFASDACPGSDGSNWGSEARNIIDSDGPDSSGRRLARRTGSASETAAIRRLGQAKGPEAASGPALRARLESSTPSAQVNKTQSTVTGPFLATHRSVAAEEAPTDEDRGSWPGLSTLISPVLSMRPNHDTRETTAGKAVLIASQAEIEGNAKVALGKATGPDPLTAEVSAGPPSFAAVIRKAAMASDHIPAAKSEQSLSRTQFDAGVQIGKPEVRHAQERASFNAGSIFAVSGASAPCSQCLAPL